MLLFCIPPDDLTHISVHRSNINVLNHQVFAQFQDHVKVTAFVWPKGPSRNDVIFLEEGGCHLKDDER